MLLAVNIGNSSIRFAIFEKEDVFNSWVINTKPFRTEDEYFAIFRNMYQQHGLAEDSVKEIVVGSVVPSLTQEVISALFKIHKIQPVLVDRYSQSAIQHESDHIGTDLYANAVAADKLFNGKKIVVDFGTALTLTCIDENGRMLGVVIAPGVNTALKSLVKETAQLPNIELSKPKRVLGLDTISCMQSGIVYGYLSMVEGLIERIKEEINGHKTLVISTGGLGHVYAPLTNLIQINDTMHTVKGLMFLYRNQAMN